MNRFKLLSLQYDNFMGSKQVEIVFSDHTTISGKNESGKTRAYDAFTWLLFGKNHDSKEAFDIKNTVDRTLNTKDHIVSADLLCGDEKINLKKVYKEVWKTVKGSPHPQFSGHTTDYYYNLVPCSATDYKNKVDALVSEEVAKAITQVDYFLTKLDWPAQRKILEQMAEIPTDAEIASDNIEFQEMLLMLTGKTIEALKVQKEKERSVIKQKVDEIPIKIKEAERLIEDVVELQDEAMLLIIKQKIEAKKKERDNITANNKSKFDAINEQQKKLSSLKNELNEATAKRRAEAQAAPQLIQKEITESKGNRDLLISEKRLLQEKANSTQSTIDEKVSENNNLREKISELNAEVPPEVTAAQTTCPTCKNSLNSDQISSVKSDLLENWNKDKVQRGITLNNIGSENKRVIEEAKKALQGLNEKILEIDTKIAHLNLHIEEKTSEYNAAKEGVQDIPSQKEEELLKKIADFKIDSPPVIDYSEYDETIAKLEKENDAIVKNVAKIEANKKIETRVEALKKEEAEMRQRMTEIDKIVFTINAFNREKSYKIEESVNKLFMYTKVQMFEKQVNGDLKDTCLFLYKGVPSRVVNTAGLINMGLDIIIALTKFYKASLPIFINNAESVNETIDTGDIQLIKLKVTLEPELTVTHN